ncbi:CDK-activating kinase assembly factor MAT1 [Trichoplax sp. H2]|uniref:RING-type domain-containing protein n=1 Tax=Trichoplax adhaerens TaxID=10228 RepID=B3RJT9_TRIAD|nr:hypothetical protein TRIADDRAFT_52675 [Trichoplax adhaerens]EDV29119.1 hypothetical protein TRIADDRAFT_52675 [Trichoplax adhaerens]RDD42974.1 CDK-activating kinase assembly factor MAT1 [Trichoplax sp. H2]|eukprot:XP_002108321.1 hypothetical protein TRIADDRAFT_52675 [Trichoplax adhaerens]
MDDTRAIYCLGCKTSSYQNPKLKFLVNACGHRLCDGCIKAMFVRPSAPCPQCGTILKRSEFRDHLFDDAHVEKEIDIRKKILKVYNKQEDDFKLTSDYDDYLEAIESIIYNLTNGINVDETKAKVEKYKKDNQALIARNRSRLNLEQERITTMVKTELDEIEKKKEKLLLEEKEELRKRRSDKEALLNDLTYADAPVDTVLANYKKTHTEQMNKKNLLNKNMDEKVVFFTTDNKEEGYTYIPFNEDNLGPKAPSPAELLKEKYVRNVHISEELKGGGFTTLIVCNRAIQEAFSCLLD